jgi:hypothetical protein
MVIDNSNANEAMPKAVKLRSLFKGGHLLTTLDIGMAPNLLGEKTTYQLSISQK